ncbi:mechanosensitive ion channel family protein [Thauera sp. 2A1]|uniref:mechanosensitive ion channel family protein n=1 Tax=Thauera sp. 2A1 TaxID=2570191 RepID=UPI001290CB0A|nr:mechanosensitive ion channel domain-containing protein [Thauera sp. 2A1]KAI5912757.1 mechanosensitive ion channel [Thauera sp. 2A1]
MAGPVQPIPATAEAVTTEFASLLRNIWDDLHDPFVLWQVGALLACLLGGWLIQRLVRQRTGGAVLEDMNAALRFGRSGLRRVVFPLSALILVLVTRAVLAQYHKVHLLDLAVPLLSSMAVIRIVVYTVRQAVGGASSWLGGFEKSFAALAWSVVALHILGWLPRVIDALETVSFSMGTQKLTLWMLVQGLAMVLLTVLVALWVAGLLERRIVTASGLDANMRTVLTRITKALLIVVAVLVALPMVGIDLTTLSVFGGALGVGLGFGLQKIAANYVSGFIILLDRSIRIGNLITVGNDRGVVREITTRYTVVKAGNGIESIIPNETLVGSVVQNETFSDTKVSLPISIQVGYEVDVERALAILVEVAGAHPRVLPEPSPKGFLAGFGESGIDLRLLCWIADPEEGTLGITSAINLELWRRFKREGISIPFPQREVRVVGAVVMNRGDDQDAPTSGAPTGLAQAGTAA